MGYAQQIKKVHQGLCYIMNYVFKRYKNVFLYLYIYIYMYWSSVHYTSCAQDCSDNREAGRAYCFHDCMYITPILHLWDLSTSCVVNHLWPLINFWTLLISSSIFLMRFKVIFDGVIMALSVMKLSLWIDIK